MAIQFAQNKVEAASNRVSVQARRLLGNPKQVEDAFERRYDDETKEFIRFWFPAKSIRGLLSLWMAIEAVEDRKVRDILALGFSRIIIAKTNGASKAIDLPHTRPHRDLTKIVPDPLVLFPSRLNAVVRRLPMTAVSNEVPLHVSRADARRIPLSATSVDLVVTSSPYANAIDYVRSHKFTLVWMGYAVAQMRDLRSSLIGAETGLRSFEGEMAWMEPRLSRLGQKFARQIAILRHYFCDMNTVLAEIFRVLRPQGACVLVLGRSTVGDFVIDTPRYIGELAKRLGFEYLGMQTRAVWQGSRSLPFPTHSNGGPLSRRMRTEQILALGKP